MARKGLLEAVAYLRTSSAANTGADKDSEKRQRATGVKVEGRKNYAEINPDMVALARKLRRYKVQGRNRTLRAIAAELAQAGFVTGTGRSYPAAAVAKMIAA